MRRALPTSLFLLASLTLTACTSGATPSPSSAAPSVAPSVAASEAPSVAPSATPDACAKDSLKLTTAGKLTVGTDNPAYPPYFAQNPAGNPQPWDKDQGDPDTTARASKAPSPMPSPSSSGFAKADVMWVVAPFNNGDRAGPEGLRLRHQPGVVHGRPGRRRST